MPHVARLYALPSRLAEEGIIRYGFHGLSYEYVMEELRRLETEAAAGRVVVAHLGNGASMAAVRGGVGVDTTMGFTPTGGLVMSTRSSDLDPSVPLFLLEERGLTPTEVSDLVNKQAASSASRGRARTCETCLSARRTTGALPRRSLSFVTRGRSSW